MKLLYQSYMIKDRFQMQLDLENLRKTVMPHVLVRPSTVSMDQGIAMFIKDGLMEPEDYNTVVRIFQKYVGVDLSFKLKKEGE